MNDYDDNPGDDSAPKEQLANELASVFAAMWDEQPSPPDVFSFLNQNEGASSDERLAVLLCDQQRRWEANDPLPVENYAPALSDAPDHPRGLLKLLVAEYELRSRSGAPTELHEFVSRYPGLEADFRSSLQERSPQLADDVGDRGGTAGDSADADLSDPTMAQTVSHSSARPVKRKQRIGRYVLVHVLGQGGFGQVWLAADEDLQRHVAVKIPSPDRFKTGTDAETFLLEARTLARLDNPHILPVHDVGRTEDGAIYLVSKYIQGHTLTAWIADRRLTQDEAAELIAKVGRALHYAHEKRVIHRDIKPSNILIEERTNHPYVADFGLAVSEDQFHQDFSKVGTPTYMSPEQILGEGHRIDARSDIFSLGVVMYEVLTGRRPFHGSTRNELYHQIVHVTPTPPHELDSAIHPELERICMKAISKRLSDRYNTAAELADDLTKWRETPRSTQQQSLIIPRGLRSFDAEDAEFFLDLLPGPRDREGLPDSIRFWKTRIEERDSSRTFAVGLLFGPSGCGKSSLVRAGLIPHVSNRVIVIRVEATPEDTEGRLLRAIRRAVPSCPQDAEIVESLMAVRRSGEKKVTIILDQFEQWLHVNPPDESAPLVYALRQCDGRQLQAICLVRDDFAMAASRFMDALDVPIVQGHNFAVVDLFDPEHAAKVLAHFGRAFGKLPRLSSQLSVEQQEFLQRVAEGLSQDGMIVPVRLSLFADMIKNRPWQAETMNEIGGTRGIGVRFLNETFSARTANPVYRRHQAASREVLKLLLPAVGTDIKGTMRSHAELLKVSGYESSRREFNELLRILDGELRLITPTDPEGSDTESRRESNSIYYQLTHDYLVGPLRDWLTRKQQESFRGRAELRLADAAALWSRAPERSVLPSFRETLSIHTLTRRSTWNARERQMMKKASQHHSYRAAGLLAGFILLCVIGYQGFSATRAHGLVESLLQANTTEVPSIIEAMDAHRRWVNPRLQRELAERSEESPTMVTAGSRQKLHLCLALLPADRQQLEYLERHLLSAEPRDIDVMLQQMRPYSNELTPRLWQSLATSFESDTAPQQLRAACALAAYDPHNDEWSSVAESIAAALLEEGPQHTDQWSRLLEPVQQHLLAPLVIHFRDASGVPGQRELAARVLARFATGELLADLILDADAHQFQFLFSALEESEGPGRGVILAELDRPLEGDQEERFRRANRQRNAGLALLRMGDLDHALERLNTGPDPTVRSSLITGMREFGVPLSSVRNAIVQSRDPVVRQALLIAAEAYGTVTLNENDRRDLIKVATASLNESRFHAERSAAQWLLDRWSAAEPISQPEPTAGPRLESDRNPELRSCRFEGPIEFEMGAPPDEAGREPHEERHTERIEHGFEVSAHEITVRQFREFRPRAGVAEEITDSLDCPMNRVSWVNAIRFCRWLSDQQKIPETEMCYPPIADIDDSFEVDEELLQRGGFRLLTDAEWEYACRAGSSTPWSCGSRQDDLPLYAWFSHNSDSHLWPVGLRAPNAFGLFDISGNVGEWCHPTVAQGKSKCGLRGGAYQALPIRLRSSQQFFFEPKDAFSFTGLRIGRTIRADAVD